MIIYFSFPSNKQTSLSIQVTYYLFSSSKSKLLASLPFNVLYPAPRSQIFWQAVLFFLEGFWDETKLESQLLGLSDLIDASNYCLTDSNDCSAYRIGSRSTIWGCPLISKSWTLSINSATLFQQFCSKMVSIIEGSDLDPRHYSDTEPTSLEWCGARERN